MCRIERMKRHTAVLSHEHEGVREVLYRHREKTIEDEAHEYVGA